MFATCSKLNSQQVSTLLHNCSLSEGEVAVNPAFASELIVLAQAHRDEALQNDGLEINLEEDPNLELPFLIPQQGYSCDNIVGIPPGLQDYFEPMISAGEGQKHCFSITNHRTFNACFMLCCTHNIHATHMYMLLLVFTSHQPRTPAFHFSSLGEKLKLGGKAWYI